MRGRSRPELDFSGKKWAYERTARSIEKFAYGVCGRKFGPCLSSAARFIPILLYHTGAALVKSFFQKKCEPYTDSHFCIITSSIFSSLITKNPINVITFTSGTTKKMQHLMKLKTVVRKPYFLKTAFGCRLRKSLIAPQTRMNAIQSATAHAIKYHFKKIILYSFLI